MINPPQPRRVLIAPKLKTLDIEARPSTPLGRAVFTELVVRLIRAGNEQQTITQTHIAPAPNASVSSPQPARTTSRKVAS